MFLTLDHSEVPLGALLDGGRAWRYVEYLASYPYFHVSALEASDEGTRIATLLVYTVHDLLDLAAAEPQGWLIQRVQLVSPGQMNGTGEWQMDLLNEIVRTEIAGRCSYAYMLHSGASYFDQKDAQHLPRHLWESVLLLNPPRNSNSV